MGQHQQRLDQALKTLRAKLPSYTPEQLAAARRKVAEDNAVCRLDCPNCEGRGFVKGEDGHVHTCPNVDPFTLYKPERFGLFANERALDWPEIDPVNDTVEQAVAAVQEALQRGVGWVYLWGEYGLGKTLILKTAVAQSLRSHKLGAYVRMSELMDNLRDGYNQQAPSDQAQARLAWWKTLPLLAVDEFSRVNDTEWVTEKRFTLMDYRYEAATRGEQGVTVIASNVDPATMEGYLYSRVRDNRFKIIKVTGEDYRLGAEWGQP